MTKTPLNVLFLCTHNSARSIIAEAVMNKLGAGRFKAYSAGSQPSGRVHPYALDMLGKLGYDISNMRSKSWEEFTAPEAPQLDFVFTVCDNAANETCPVWPGQPISAHWGLPDPSSAQGTDSEKHLAFADTHRMLYQRIGIFVNLPLASLDSLSLQRRLDEIGQSTPTPERA
jgi:arsenate reductase